MESAHLPLSKITIGANEHTVAPYAPQENVNNLWREIRVYTPYDITLSYKGYTESQYNEYVISSSSSDISITLDLINFTVVNSTTKAIYLADILKGADDFIVQGGYVQQDFDIDSDGLGASADISYTVSPSRDFLYLHLDTTDTSISLSLVQYNNSALRKVKRASVDPLTNDNISYSNAFGGAKWVEADICGKSITSCATRFKSFVVDATAPSNIPAAVPQPISIKFSSKNDIVAGNIRLDSAVFSSLAQSGKLQKGILPDQYSYALSTQYDTANFAKSFSRFLQDIQVSSSSATYTSGFTIAGSYAADSFVGLAQSNIINNNEAGFEYNVNSLHSSPYHGDFVNANINYMHLYRPLADASIYDTPYRGSGSIPAPPIPNSTPIFSSVFNELHAAISSMIMYEAGLYAQYYKNETPGTQAYIATLAYYEYNLANNLGFLATVALKYEKVPNSTTDIQLYLDPYDYLIGANSTVFGSNAFSNAPLDMLPAATWIPVPLSTSADPAYQQFAYSNVGSGGTDLYAEFLTEKDFLTGKMYLTDDRTVSGKDQILVTSATQGIGAGANNLAQLSIEPQDNITLPFGGFPGSRRFQ